MVGNNMALSEGSQMDSQPVGADSARQFEGRVITKDTLKTLKSHRILSWLPSSSVDMNTPDTCSVSSAVNGGLPTMMNMM